jgi:hypothetical protein
LTVSSSATEDTVDNEGLEDREEDEEDKERMLEPQQFEPMDATEAVRLRAWFAMDCV